MYSFCIVDSNFEEYLEELNDFLFVLVFHIITEKDGDEWPVL